jgi:hypothetical protein
MNRLTSILSVIVLITSGRINSVRDSKSSNNKLDIQESKIHQQSLESDTLSIKCNLAVILEIEKDIDSLTIPKMKMFLEIFSKDCRNNAEFSELSNELLFTVIARYPELFISVMCDKITDTDSQEIYFQLSQPIHDLIPVDSIFNIINLTKQDCSQLDSIKKYLKIAKENN